MALTFVPYAQFNCFCSFPLRNGRSRSVSAPVRSGRLLRKVSSVPLSRKVINQMRAQGTRSDGRGSLPQPAFSLTADQIREDFRSSFQPQADGRLTLVKGLTADWVHRVRVVLQQQSDTDGYAFDASIARLLSNGYRLTSLVARLSYLPPGSTADLGRLQCEVHAKIGAKPVFAGKDRRGR